MAHRLAAVAGARQDGAMRTVTVVGHGQTRVAPDSAVVRVAAVHRAAGVADALAGADSAAQQIVRTGREFTEPEQIGSTSLQIWPSRDELNRPDGFQARHSLTLRCGDIEAAGSLLTALAEQVGARLEIEGVSLEVSDESAAAGRAREAAYADAVERAAHLAGLAGAELGDPQDVVEGGVASGPVRMAMALSVSASLEPGESTVQSSVTVTFQLR
jgi:uncharacterized protein YggE